MTVERWAQQIIEATLHRSVVIHDDGSQPSMYDLRIGPADAPEVAIECVGAVDPVRTETWNEGPAKGPITLNVQGDWSVIIAPNARLRPITAQLEGILRQLEHQGWWNTHVDYRLKRLDAPLFHHLERLGVLHAFCTQVPGRGQAQLLTDGIGGVLMRPGVHSPLGLRRSSKRRGRQMYCENLVRQEPLIAMCLCLLRSAALHGPSSRI